MQVAVEGCACYAPECNQRGTLVTLHGIPPAVVDKGRMLDTPLRPYGGDVSRVFGLFFVLHPEGDVLMAQNNPHRRGIAKTITIDFDAVAILMELSGGKNCQGRFVSDLLRAERVRCEERERVRKALQEVLP